MRVMTDNGSCYRTAAAAKFCRKLLIKHIRTKSCTQPAARLSVVHLSAQKMNARLGNMNSVPPSELPLAEFHARFVARMQAFGVSNDIIDQCAADAVADACACDLGPETAAECEIEITESIAKAGSLHKSRPLQRGSH